MALVDINRVWQNFVGIAVIIAVFYFLYKSMRENKFKKSIRETLRGFKND